MTARHVPRTAGVRVAGAGVLSVRIRGRLSSLKTKRCLMLLRIPLILSITVLVIAIII